MPVLEAQTVVDIVSAFGITSEKEIVQWNVLELPNAELVTDESGSSEDAAVSEASSSVQEDSGMAVVYNKLAFRNISDKEMQNSNVLELPNAEIVTEESGDSDDAAVFEVSSSVQKDTGMPVVEAQTTEDIESAFRITSEKGIVHSDVLELPNAKLVTEESDDSDYAAEFDVSSSVQNDSGRPMVEAQTVEGIESAFRTTSEKGIENSNVLELPNAKLVTEESGSSNNAAEVEVSSSVLEDSGMPVLESLSVENIELAFRSTSEKEIVHSDVPELPNAKLVTEESGSLDDAAVFEVSSSVTEDSGMPVLEAQTVEDIELAFRNISEKEIENLNVLELPNAKLVTEESGVSDDAAAFEVSSSVQNDSGMPVVEAQAIEDIESAFKIASETEIVHSDVLEQPNAKLVAGESGDFDEAAVFDMSSSIQEDSGMPVVEAQAIEDIESAFRSIYEKEIVHSNVPELPDAQLVTEESRDSDDAAVFDVSSSVLEDSGMPVLEAQTVEDINLAFRQISEQEIEKSDVLEQPNVKVVTEESGDSDYPAVFDVSSSVHQDSGMPVLEAQTVEDIESAFRQISEQEIAEKSDVLEQPNAELATEESGNIVAAAEVSSSALEAQTVEDIDMVFRRISEKEIQKSNVLEQHNAELATEVSGSSDKAAVLEVSMQLPILETRPTEYFDLDHEKLSESDDEKLFHHGSVGGDEPESKDTGASSDSQNIETDLALKKVLEGTLNSTSEGESAEAKPNGASLSNDIESSVRGSECETGKGDHEVVVKEAKAFTAEKPEQAVDMPTTSDVKGKKDKLHKMGSSSSSSSDSSSSDSDRE